MAAPSKIFTLYELNSHIKRVFKENFSNFWVTAEIAEMRVRNGHCYLKLAEKSEEDDSLIAKADATIWRSSYELLSNTFEEETGRSLAVGLRVMLLVTPTFSEKYGFSLNVLDIESSYTLGEIARRRREILERLKRDGLIDKNKRLEFPLLPKRVAVVSSETAAGWGDFQNHLLNNPYGYLFEVTLFDSLMQGDGVEASVTEVLKDIYAISEEFDVIVIIRGGGATTDLSCFDSYLLGMLISDSPLPVISGIGHERDVTVIDEVAHTRVKTPTAAADLLIEAFYEQEQRCLEALDRLKNYSASMLNGEIMRTEKSLSSFKSAINSVLIQRSGELATISTSFKSATNSLVLQRSGELAGITGRLDALLQHVIGIKRGDIKWLTMAFASRVRSNLVAMENYLDRAETMMRHSDPERVLERGFSITRVAGKSIRDASTLKSGDMVETTLAKGKIISTINEIENGERVDLQEGN